MPVWVLHNVNVVFGESSSSTLGLYNETHPMTVQYEYIINMSFPSSSNWTIDFFCFLMELIAFVILFKLYIVKH